MDLDFKHSFETFGINLPPIVESDSSSAKSYASSTRIRQATTCSNALLWDPRRDCSEQFRDQEITDNKQRQRHLGESDGQEKLWTRTFRQWDLWKYQRQRCTNNLEQALAVRSADPNAGHKIMMDASHGKADGYNQVPIQKHVDGCKLELSF